MLNATPYIDVPPHCSMPQPDTNTVAITATPALNNREHKTLQNRLSMLDINGTPVNFTGRRFGILNF
jgi:hypothetical protein